VSAVGAPARGGDLSSPPVQTPGSARDAARRLSASPWLSQRRLELLPLSGPGSVFSDVQGRRPGASTTPEDLAELVSSIASVGVLQPILVERLPDETLRLVAGERRLRAARWGAANLPPNPHFDVIPAVVCPGPLPEEDRRTWQIAENLVRVDLAPGELAAALVFERCAVLTTKLLTAGVPVPGSTVETEDPLQRFRALERIRLEAHLHKIGAPWEEVLGRLGIQPASSTVPSPHCRPRSPPTWTPPGSASPPVSTTSGWTGAAAVPPGSSGRRPRCGAVLSSSRGRSASASSARAWTPRPLSGPPRHTGTTPTGLVHGRFVRSRPARWRTRPPWRPPWR
jgi:hypothetical protein